MSIATTSRSALSGCASPAGNRLRVTIGSSDFPQWDRNLNTGGTLFQEPASAAVVATQTVLHDAQYASHLTVHAMRSRLTMSRSMCAGLEMAG